ncbi:hypothetical protein CEXT_506401 [Caerostris extrusa]|uniref:Uncharacterized protein n=1 Tax=Caerostris extrusa TaxID=172846 RepID=A0AAV4RXZ2_CAEEX|nr:hypothetical protein CEXT_506401 [Caerostris extrusa]
MSASYQTPVKPFKSSTLFGGKQSKVGALEHAPSSPPVKTKIKPVVPSLLCDNVFSSNQWLSVLYATMRFNQINGSQSSM